MPDPPTPGRLPGGIRRGALRARENRPIKNGRWYIAGRDVLTKVGWGDLSFFDLDAIAADLHDGEIFLALPESPPGGQHLPFHEPGEPIDAGSRCWYDRPDDPPGPTIADLVGGARYAVLDGQVRYVDSRGEANRLGNVRIERGYRYTRTGRILSTGKIRLPVITPDQLAGRLIGLTGDPERRSTNDVNPGGRAPLGARGRGGILDLDKELRMPSTRRRTFTVASVDLTELESRVAAWETKYGVRSDAMAEAFTRDGVLAEDDDYLEWSHDWAALQAARQPGR